MIPNWSTVEQDLVGHHLPNCHQCWLEFYQPVKTFLFLWWSVTVEWAFLSKSSALILLTKPHTRLRRRNNLLIWIQFLLQIPISVIFEKKVTNSVTTTSSFPYLTVAWKKTSKTNWHWKDTCPVDGFWTFNTNEECSWENPRNCCFNHWFHFRIFCTFCNFSSKTNTRQPIHVCKAGYHDLFVFL